MKKFIDKNILYLIMISALLVVFSFAPYCDYPTIFIGYLVLFYSFYISKSSKTAFFYGFTFGLVHFTVGFYWLFSIMTGYGVADKIMVFVVVIGIILTIAILFGILGYISNISRIKNKCFTFWSTIYIPILATIFEYIRSFLFTGLTWYTPANSIFEIGVSSVLPLGGVVLLNAIFFTIIGILLHVIIYKKEQIIYISSLGCLIVIIVFSSKYISYTKPMLDKKIKIHIISSNFSKKDKSSRYKTVERVEKFASYALLEPIPNLSIWPESTISTDYDSVAPHIQSTINKLKENNITVLTGAYIKFNEHLYNTLFSLTDEQIVYAKQHLIPFGEYIPTWMNIFKNILPEIFINNLSWSQSFAKTISYGDINISSSICYEILFPDELRENTNNSNLLLHISDLGWFNQVLAKSYLLQEARMRAIESQKQMIYVVNSGISAFIDKNGQILKISEKNLQKNVYYDIIPQEGYTYYTKYGNKVSLIYAFLILFLFLTTKKEEICKHI